MRDFKQKMRIIWQLLTDGYTSNSRHNTWFIWDKVGSKRKCITLVFADSYLLVESDNRYVTYEQYYADNPVATVSGTLNSINTSKYTEGGYVI